MDILYINKEKILCNFEELSNVWDASVNISLHLDIQIPDFELIVTELLKKPSNDLAYSILSEMAEKNGLDERLMRLIYEQGNKACKVAISLRNDLPMDLKVKCADSNDADVREHYFNMP